MPQVIEALAGLPVVAIVATAGRAALPSLPSNVIARRFVRGGDVAARAALVISNGGSTTGYQALARGTPVLGLPSNFDQHLATEVIDRAGAGISLKARLADARLMRAAIERALGDAQLRRAAARVAASFAKRDSAAVFRAFVDEPGVCLKPRGDAGQGK